MDSTTTRRLDSYKYLIGHEIDVEEPSGDSGGGLCIRVFEEYGAYWAEVDYGYAFNLTRATKISITDNPVQVTDTCPSQ